MDLSASSVSVVMLLLSASVLISSPHQSERTFPRVVPSKLQLFVYDDLTVNCEGFFNHTSQWMVVRKMNSTTTPCKENGTMYGPYHISAVYTTDSGEYWCESREPPRRSESVHITVTDGNVILDSPVRPVMVGDDVTLHCKTKKASTEFSFYKDANQINSSRTAELRIHNISVSNQGLYKCSTTDGEFSVENPMQVRAVLLQCPDRPVMEGTNVTLYCRDKMAAPNHMSSFYKDGVIIGNSSSGQLTLIVSKSVEGVYKCRSSEGGESEEQWLAVRGSSDLQENKETERSIPVGHDTIVIIISVLIGLGVLPLVFIFFMNKVNVSEKSIEEIVVYLVMNNEGVKKEQSSFSQTGQASVFSSVEEWELYSTVVYSEKSKDV